MQAPGAKSCTASSGVFLPHIKARCEPPGWQMLRTRGCVLQPLYGMHPGPVSKQGWDYPDVFLSSLPMHPKAKLLRCPWKSAPVFATNCWCRAHAGAVSSVLPQQTARPSRKKVVSHFRNPVCRESSVCNLAFPASLLLLPGTHPSLNPSTLH